MRILKARRFWYTGKFSRFLRIFGLFCDCRLTFPYESYKIQSVGRFLGGSQYNKLKKKFAISLIQSDGGT